MELTAYRIFRHSVLRLVEFIVQYLESGGIQNISELMLPHDASQYALKKFSALDMTGDIVILLDDIMYYTSMRHSIYKLSKKCKYKSHSTFIHCWLEYHLELSSLVHVTHLDLDM